MCSIVYVGVSGCSGDASGLFRERGFEVSRVSNESCAELPGTARFEVTVGGCSCSLYVRDAAAQGSRTDSLRRKYRKKGWSSAKIERALASTTRTHSTPQMDARDHATQFAHTLQELVLAGAKVTLLAHFFNGAFTEPFQVLGSTALPVEHYVRGRNRLPEDQWVSIIAT